MRNKKQELNVNHQWQAYLKRGGLVEDKMHTTQRVETKRAFYGGFGQALIALRDQISDDEDAAVEELQNMHAQVLAFFIQEVKEGG